MRSIRMHVVLALTAVLALSLVVSTAPAAVAAVGKRIRLHPHTTFHDYQKPYHRASGKLGIENRSKHKVKLRCQVVVLFLGPGTTHKRGRDQVALVVPRKSLRKVRFAVKVKDAHHKFDNVPTSTVGHCHRKN